MDWMVKEALYLPQPGQEPPAQVLDESEGSHGIKIACTGLLPEVQRFVDTFQPKPDCKYVLVNAMGASEYYGMNANKDAFPEHALVNVPKGWTGNPDKDRELSKGWTYGFPTFYQAGVFSHHRNKEHDKRLGQVALAAWNDRMKRVELVLEVEKERSHQYNGAGFWNSMEKGELPAVSMGARVKFDRCSRCTDLETFYRALRAYDPKKHANPGMAVLEEHIRLRDKAGIPRDAKGITGGIRGIGRVRSEYCDCMKYHAGEIDPETGVQIFVYNDFPLFFDISLVFIPADRTALGIQFLRQHTGNGAPNMVKKGHIYVPAELAGTEKTASLQRLIQQVQVEKPEGGLEEYIKGGLGGNTVAEGLARFDQRPHQVTAQSPWFGDERRTLSPLPAPRASRDSGNVDPTKTASDASIKAAEQAKKARQAKKAEMDKKIDNETPVEEVRSHARGESFLPRDVLNHLGSFPLSAALGTTGALGIVLRPREYQRVVLVNQGMGSLADRFDDAGMCFGYAAPPPPSRCPGMSFLELLASMLAPLLAQRSGFSPYLRERISVRMPRDEAKTASALPEPLFSSLGASYQGYRGELLSRLASSQAKLAAVANQDLQKIAHLQPEDLFTPLSFSYFRLAYQDEVVAPR